MKRNRNGNKRMLLATAGALLICATPLVYADDVRSGRQADQQFQPSQSDVSESIRELEEFEPSEQFDVKGEEINEPAGTEKKTDTSNSSYRDTKSSRLSSIHQSSFGSLNKTADLIGMDVRTSQDEKLGEIKDVMVDVKSGRVPFVILSPEGFADDRLIALPPSALSLGTEEKNLVLNIDKEKMRSAPSFERAQWPDMANQQFSSEVYRFYNTKPYWQGSSLESDSVQSHAALETSESSVTVTEPAGARITTQQQETYGIRTGSADEIDARANEILHMYQAGKQSAAATDRRLQERPAEVIIPAPSTYKGRYLHNSELHMNTPAQWEVVEPSGAERRTSQQTTTYQAKPSHSMPAHSMKFHRATQLMGMNIKDAQGQTVGEIKDLAIDLHSGRVAYTMVSAGGFLGVGEKWVAVPPALYSVSGEQALTLNVDKNTLKTAPVFERSNWEAASNQEFVSRVYTHYGQQPYWQAGTTLREPAGTQRDEQFQQQQNDLQEQQYDREQQQLDLKNQRDELKDEVESPDQSGLKSDSQLNEPAGIESPSTEVEPTDSQSVEEPAGAPSSPSEVNESEQEKYQSENLGDPSGTEQEDKQAPERSSSTIEEPSGVETPESSEENLEQTSTPEQEPSAPSAGFQSEVNEEEAAGSKSQAEQSVDVQTESSQIEEAAGASREQISPDQIRAKLHSDSSISGSQNVQVTSENGKIVLKGTVHSETEKQQIEQKVREMIVDNQLQVQGESEEDIEDSPDDE